jgi:hypothetical protein
MRETIKIAAEDVQPDQEDVFSVQGIPADKRPSATAEAVFEEMRSTFATYTHCVGVVADVSISQFASIYAGEGLNEKVTPLGEIFKKADYLACFAVTVGGDVSQKIDELFRTHEYAQAGMLDAFASAGAEKAACLVEDHYYKQLLKSERSPADTAILQYSPGYCGWHVSGQKKLFAFLKPEDIGITLLGSYLMQPLKSISGVLVAGKKEIHLFRDTYVFCGECQTHSCQSRIQQLLEEHEE